MVFEVALVFDAEGKTLFWHEPQDSSHGIEDSQDLWDVLWENRHRLGGVAHTHPWDGEAAPSQTDLTTFAAVEKGLGKRLMWPVVTFTDVAYIAFHAPTGVYVRYQQKHVRGGGIEGIDELRRRSGSNQPPPQ